MPIYAYRCEDCGFEKDVLQKLSDAPLTDCPQCHAPRFVKQVTAAGFQLKGSGWYVTDFRNSGGSSNSKPAAGKSASAEGGASTSASSQPSSSAGVDASGGAPAGGTGGCGAPVPS
jgi:putative FmdB family regulatory protein